LYKQQQKQPQQQEPQQQEQEQCTKPHSSVRFLPDSVGFAVVPPSTERILAAVQAKADRLTPGLYWNTRQL